MKFLEEELDRLRNEGLFRKPLVFMGGQSKKLKLNNSDIINFCSNDYLGFCSRKEIKEAEISAIQKWGAGSGASRLVTGTTEIHRRLEERVAEFEKKESAIIFPTGYMANVGTISALVGEGDAVIIDRLNHASIIDGAKLSGAKLYVYPHRDLNRLEYVLKKCKDKKRKLVVTDSIFSMDGDLAPLREMVELKDKYGAMLMVDEAHGTGVFGETGSGLGEALGVKDKIDVLMGTFSKAIGVLGGFIAGSKELTEYLENKARSYIYTTSPAPAICGAVLEAIELIEKEPGTRKNLLKKAKKLRGEISSLGMSCMDSESQIIPIAAGEADEAVRLSHNLLEKGIFVQAIRPPTVPKGSSRLRVTLSAEHSEEEIKYLLDCLRRCA